MFGVKVRCVAITLSPYNYLFASGIKLPPINFNWSQWRDSNPQSSRALDFKSNVYRHFHHTEKLLELEQGVEP